MNLAIALLSSQTVPRIQVPGTAVEEVSLMPSTPMHDDFAGRMTAEQKAVFRKMSDLIGRRSASLAWHHSMGRNVLDWRRAVRGAKPGTFAQLAEALEISTAQLVKAARFADEYSADEVARLDREGVNWGLIVATQRTAKHERKPLFRMVTSGQRNLAELGSLIDTKRHGERHAGGRPPRKPPNLELGLRQMKRMCQRWLRFHQEVWPRVCPAPGGREQSQALRQLVKEARQAVIQVESVAAQVERSLRG